ncbi:hypothetical protein B6U83_00155 [Thermoplasmatales archaeon ex4484_36]|nr:MAG: hypothetical protein B6U83_00155 [Thermoplasmatales archaeon ex4484_36]
MMRGSRILRKVRSKLNPDVRKYKVVEKYEGPGGTAVKVLKSELSAPDIFSEMSIQGSTFYFVPASLEHLMNTSPIPLSQSNNMGTELSQYGCEWRNREASWSTFIKGSERRKMDISDENDPLTYIFKRIYMVNNKRVFSLSTMLNNWCSMMGLAPNFYEGSDLDLYYSTHRNRPGLSLVDYPDTDGRITGNTGVLGAVFNLIREYLSGWEVTGKAHGLMINFVGGAFSDYIEAMEMEILKWLDKPDQRNRVRYISRWSMSLVDLMLVTDFLMRTTFQQYHPALIYPDDILEMKGAMEALFRKRSGAKMETINVSIDDIVLGMFSDMGLWIRTWSSSTLYSDKAPSRKELKRTLDLLKRYASWFMGRDLPDFDIDDEFVSSLGICFQLVEEGIYTGTKEFPTSTVLELIMLKELFHLSRYTLASQLPGFRPIDLNEHGKNIVPRTEKWPMKLIPPIHGDCGPTRDTYQGSVSAIAGMMGFLPHYIPREVVWDERTERPKVIVDIVPLKVEPSYQFEFNEMGDESDIIDVLLSKEMCPTLKPILKFSKKRQGAMYHSLLNIHSDLFLHRFWSTWNIHNDILALPHVIPVIDATEIDLGFYASSHIFLMLRMFGYTTFNNISLLISEDEKTRVYHDGLDPANEGEIMKRDFERLVGNGKLTLIKRSVATKVDSTWHYVPGGLRFTSYPITTYRAIIEHLRLADGRLKTMIDTIIKVTPTGEPASIAITAREVGVKETIKRLWTIEYAANFLVSSYPYMMELM